MGVTRDHPDLILWYVTGAIGLKERRDIEAHLQECEECRAEVSSLTSMMKSVRVQDRWEHVGAADLVLFEEDPRAMPDERKVAIEAHLAECPQCRTDLTTLGEARRRAIADTPAERPQAGGRNVRGGWILAAAAALLLLLVVWPYRFGAGPPVTPSVQVRSVVFPAPLRAAEAMRTLEESGPWQIRILLPFGAKEGKYRVEYRRAGGALLSGAGTSASTDADLCLTVVLDKLPGPGRYEMTLRPEPPGSGESYLYSFRLLPRTPAGSDPASP